jgi:hypothetical protein
MAQDFKLEMIEEHFIGLTIKIRFIIRNFNLTMK